MSTQFNVKGLDKFFGIAPSDAPAEVDRGAVGDQTVLDVNESEVGERWRIGDRVEVEVTSPRTPCQTFARWVGGADERGWVRRFSDERRLGVYLRVRRTGSITAGDEIVVLPGHGGQTTIGREKATNPYLQDLEIPNL